MNRQVLCSQGGGLGSRLSFFLHYMVGQPNHPNLPYLEARLVLQVRPRRERPGPRALEGRERDAPHLRAVLLGLASSVGGVGLKKESALNDCHGRITYKHTFLVDSTHNVARGAPDAAADVDGRAELAPRGHARELERLVDHVHLRVVCCVWWGAVRAGSDSSVSVQFTSVHH